MTRPCFLWTGSATNNTYTRDTDHRTAHHQPNVEGGGGGTRFTSRLEGATGIVHSDLKRGGIGGEEVEEQEEIILFMCLN